MINLLIRTEDFAHVVIVPLDSDESDEYAGSRNGDLAWLSRHFRSAYYAQESPGEIWLIPPEGDGPLEQCTVTTRQTAFNADDYATRVIEIWSPYNAHIAPRPLVTVSHSVDGRS
jgi:hypothetical protein